MVRQRCLIKIWQVDEGNRRDDWEVSALRRAVLARVTMMMGRLQSSGGMVLAEQRRNDHNEEDDADHPRGDGSCCRSVRLSSVAGKFGHSFLRTVVVDECLAGGGGGDQCGNGGVVQRAWQSQAGFMESRHRVIGKERITPTGQSQMVLQVPG